MKVKAGLFALFLMMSCAAYAQDTESEIVRASQDYIDAFYYGDSVKLDRCITPAIVKFGYYIKKDQTTYTGESMSYEAMRKYVRSVAKRGPNKNTSTWPNKVQVLDKQDQTACTKVTAWWGTDYLTLAKIDGQWKIKHVLWQSPPPTEKK